MTTLAHRRTFLTVREAAERLRVSEDTMRRKIERGELPAVQLGGKGASVRIAEDDLDRWLYGPPKDAA